MQISTFIALSLAVIGCWIAGILALFFLGGLPIWDAYLFGWSSLARRYRFRGPFAGTAGYHYRAGWSRAYRISGRFAGQVWRLKECRLVQMRWAGFEASLNAYFPYLPRDVPDNVSGSASYELDMGANPEGLYLAVQSGVKVWHPPLFIPWSDIAVSAERIEWINQPMSYRRFDSRGRGAPVSSGWLDCLVFRFRQAPGVLLQLREEGAGPIVAAAAGSWPELVPSQAIPTSS
jgi:hypothetical protein